jgi:hypothetical protein
MTNKQLNELMDVANRILDETIKQITFLIDNSDKIKKKTGGMVDCSKIDCYRTGVTMVYLAGLNVGILENVKLDQIFLFLDKGFFNEIELDSQIYLKSVLNG